MTKHCKKCTEEYPLDKFSKAKNNADGYSSVCKPYCHLWIYLCCGEKYRYNPSEYK